VWGALDGNLLPKCSKALSFDPSGTTASSALRNCWRCWPRASPMAASPCRS